MELEIKCGAETIECRGGKESLWVVRSDAIVLIAEYTTNEGPWLDDWFLVLWELVGSKLFKVEVPVDASTKKMVSELLSKKGDHMTGAALVTSTDWRSRVIWPAFLKEARCLNLTPIPELGVVGWIKRKFVGPSLDLNLTDEVRSYLEDVVRKATT